MRYFPRGIVLFTLENRCRSDQVIFAACQMNIPFAIQHLSQGRSEGNGDERVLRTPWISKTGYSPSVHFSFILMTSSFRGVLTHRKGYSQRILIATGVVRGLWNAWIKIRGLFAVGAYFIWGYNQRILNLVKSTISFCFYYEYISIIKDEHKYYRHVR